MGESRRILKRKEEGIFTYRLPNGADRFVVRFEHQGKDWRKFGFPTITKARQWRDTRKGRALEGRLFPEQERARQEAKAQQEAEAQQEAKAQQEAEINRIPLLREYALTWLAACQAVPLKYTTMLRYRGLVRKHLIPHLGGLRLNEIKRGHVRQLVTNMIKGGPTPKEKGASPKTVHNALRALSALYSQAIEDELVEHNPGLKPSKLIRKPHKKEVAVLTREEERLVLDTAKETLKPYYPFLLLLFRTGLREGEAVALQRYDLDFHSRYAVIRRNFTAGHLEDSPKGGKTRQVDLTWDLVNALKDHLALQEAEAALSGHPRPEWVFTSPQGGMIRSNNFRDRVWRPLLMRVGLQYRNVHAIRHTYATRMIMAGASLAYVQKQLGHSTIQLTVDLYTHWIEEADRGRTLEVDRLIPQPEMQEVGTFPGTPGPTGGDEGRGH